MLTLAKIWNKGIPATFFQNQPSLGQSYQIRSSQGFQERKNIYIC